MAAGYPKVCKPDWVKGADEVEVDLSSMGRVGGPQGFAIAITASVTRSDSDEYKYTRVISLYDGDEFEFTVWINPSGNLEVDYPDTTQLSPKGFWIADGKDHNYLFAITGEGKCLALKAHALTMSTDDNSVIEFVSKGVKKAPLTAMTDVKFGHNPDVIAGRDGALLSISNVRLFPKAVAWEEAFPRGTKRSRADVECAAGMQHVWKARKFTDFTVLCGGQSYSVHRVVLAAKSEVFASMFEKDVRETAERRVTIENAKPETVEAFLEYVYVGSVTSSACDHVDLLRLADQYSIEGLVQYCGNAIQEKFCEENASDILIGLAPFHHIAGVAGIFEELLKRSQEVVAKSPEILKAFIGRAAGVDFAGS